MRFQPFAAYLPNKEKASAIVCPPYDVMDTEEARAMAGPDSFLHIIRSEIEFPPEQDAHADVIYDRAAENLKKWIDAGLLFRDDAESLYLYRLTAFGRSQTGIAGRSHIDDYVEGRIKRHEFTRPDKEEDRLRHIDRTGCNTEPVFFAYRSEAAPRIEEILTEQTKRPADYDVTTDDGVRHEIFRIAPGAVQSELLELYRKLDAVYIADGHHRTASTVRVGLQRREQASSAGQSVTELSPFQYFLSVTFPSAQLHIMPYNRIVKDLNGLSPSDFLAALRKLGSLTERTATKSDLHRIDVYIEKKWYEFRPNQVPADVLKGLDVALLQDQVLAPLLGIDDPRTSSRIAFVGGIRGEAELMRKVDSGEYAVAFSMHATPIDALFLVADAGEVMPPKSTWFEPKLRTGFFVNSLE